MLVTLSKRAMYKLKPNWSFKTILSANWLQSSLDVVAESAKRFLVFPSMKVIGRIIGFLDFVAYTKILTFHDYRDIIDVCILMC
jgi:hypothetical protein